MLITATNTLPGTIFLSPILFSVSSSSIVGSEEVGMVCADGVYEKGTVKDMQFIAEAKALGAFVG